MKRSERNAREWDASRHEVLAFVARYDRWPNPRATDRHERSLNTWIRTQRVRCDGTKPRLDPLSPERVALLEADGMLARRQHTTNLWGQVARFIETHGRWPTSGGNADEAKLAQAIYAHRYHVRRDGGVIPEQMLHAITAAGLDPDEALPARDMTVVRADDKFRRAALGVAEFRHIHGRYPNLRSDDPGERVLSFWAKNVRYGRIVLDADRRALLDELGIADLAHCTSAALAGGRRG